ncbi:DUF5052 family protein [Paenibacillus oralis]|uniref:DUF5052 family protein n=1 Tax=Paenibacillus oralis TaxID=2490856 RepID=A0A3P3TBL2_9BACL|nr:DUF5052 family protein [Paenibacillus oralis]RRJ54914.1 DUF5052 family protein [Paenibacillus oralis]
MKKNSIYLVLLLLASLTTILSGCNFLENKVGEMKSALKGREAIIQTYDEESNIIDRIEARSIDIGPEDMFSTIDSQGNKIKNSGVLSITVGGKPMMHVGSSLILAEKDLHNIFEEFAKTINIKNLDRSTPFLNRLVNSMSNMTTGKNLLILIRSQSGKPLATYVGNQVSYFATDVDKSTGILIDGKYLFIYRCDYSIYDVSLLQEQ